MRPPTLEGEGIVSDIPIVQDALQGDRPVNDELFAEVLDNVTDMYMDAERDAELQSMFGEPSREALRTRYDELDRKREAIEEASELDTVHAQLGALRGLGAITRRAANFSDLAYVMVEPGNKSQRIARIEDQLEERGLGNWKVVRPRSNRDVLTLQDESGKRHVAYRGTDISGKATGRDLWNDANLMLGRQTADYKKRVQFGRQAGADSASGHSLGGALAKSAGARGRVDTFNAAKMPGMPGAAGDVVEHRTRGDVVSMLNPGRQKTKKGFDHSLDSWLNGSGIQWY